MCYLTPLTKTKEMRHLYSEGPDSKWYPCLSHPWAHPPGTSWDSNTATLYPEWESRAPQDRPANPLPMMITSTSSPSSIPTEDCALSRRMMDCCLSWMREVLRLFIVTDVTSVAGRNPLGINEAVWKPCIVIGTVANHHNIMSDTSPLRSNIRPVTVQVKLREYQPAVTVKLSYGELSAITSLLADTATSGDGEVKEL